MRPTASGLADYDRLPIGRTDRALSSGSDHLFGKHSDIANTDVTDLGYDLGRDAKVQVIEHRDVAYLHIHRARSQGSNP